MALVSMERSGRSPLSLSSEARRRGANPQPEGHGLTARSESRHSAAGLGEPGACAPWQSARVLHGNVPAAVRGEQGGSVPHTGPACSTSTGLLVWQRERLALSCSHGQLPLSSGRTQSLAVYTHCAACCYCSLGNVLMGELIAWPATAQLPLTSTCPPLPGCYSSQDFCFHKLLIFSLIKK